MKVNGPAYLWKKGTGSGNGLSFDAAFEKVRTELIGAQAISDVFAAHLEMLEDPLLAESVQAELNAGKGELEALDAACESVCSMFSAIDDEYLRARVDDVRDVFGRLRSAMQGENVMHHDMPAGSVIVARELLPSDAALIDFSRVAGILCSRGSSTSHVCIIARSKGVPVQLGADIAGFSDGDIVTVDDPLVGGAEVSALVRKAGRKLYANAGGVEDIRAAVAAGADGIGLFRTEFLFMGRDSMPSVSEQETLYSSALEACAGRPLTLRLLDIGGDKPLPYLPLEKEDNPFLGLRGVRLLLSRPEILRSQLEAAVAASRKFPGQLRVMIPMVDSVEEIRAVRALLKKLGGEALSLGIMVETPAAVLCAAELAAESDFFSLGTNDLTQYIMAADRGNPSVSYLYDGMAAPVLRAVRMAVEAAHAAGIPAGICGELASDPRASAALLDLGLDSFSLMKI